ncbi:MAG: S41 family peptidase [Prevotellaceae bacterium]|jgi:carboxyl-terminal processing protease|nr:S41 family peptidase [Prevotellaceae bacterium]
MSSKRNIFLALVLFLTVVTGFFLGNLLARRAGARASRISLNNFLTRQFQGNKVDEVLSLIETQYVDPVDGVEMTEELMRDLINKLDPHSVYISAEDLDNVNSELEGSFSGIGVQFNLRNDTVNIVSVISGGPSEKVGILAGDRIVEVNDSAFVGKKITNEKVMRELRGPKGTQVKLGIRRWGTPETLYYTVTRGDIPVNSVDVAYMVEPGIGFIKISKFAATTYTEFLTAIAQLKSEGAVKFIIDLRENNGGYMDQAIQMTNEFLPKNKMIVYSEGQSYPRFDAVSDGRGTCQEQPVVVLIDEFSASASEIFAGAIQDNDRGVIVGRRSFGKGLVQQQIPLSDGSAIRLTVARYYTPSGRSIQKPYEMGKGEEYGMDLFSRVEHGEFDNADSIHTADSPVYKTLNGRTVYGGGGIMPDIFVPRDTTEYTPYLNKVVNYRYLYQYAFQYTDENREALNKLKSWQDMERYLDTQDLLNKFVAYAKSKGIEENTAQINKSSSLIGRQLKSYVTRNILGEEGFFPMFYKDDKTVKTAIKELKKQR